MAIMNLLLGDLEDLVEVAQENANPAMLRFYQHCWAQLSQDAKDFHSLILNNGDYRI